MLPPRERLFPMTEGSRRTDERPALSGRRRQNARAVPWNRNEPQAPAEADFLSSGRSAASHIS